MPLSPAWRTIVRDLTEKKKRLLKGLTGWLAGWLAEREMVWRCDGIYFCLLVLLCAVYMYHTSSLSSHLASPSLLFNLVDGGKDSTLLSFPSSDSLW